MRHFWSIIYVTPDARQVILLDVDGDADLDILMIAADGAGRLYVRMIIDTVPTVR